MKYIWGNIYREIYIGKYIWGNPVKILIHYFLVLHVGKQWELYRDIDGEIYGKYMGKYI